MTAWRWKVRETRAPETADYGLSGPVLAEIMGDLAIRCRQSQSMLVETALGVFLFPEEKVRAR